MSDNKQKQTLTEAPKTKEGAASSESSIARTDTVKSSGWKKLLGKKWVFPATYMAAAAIILALMWVIQDSGKNEMDTIDLGLDGDEQHQVIDIGEEAIPVQAPAEEMEWPANRSEVEVIMPFYEPGASSEDKQAAILEQGNTFIPNTGIALSRADNAAFEVTAALSGEVSRVEHVPSVGNLVEITHEDGLVTIYYSLADVKVTKGDHVKQGEPIAKAGRNELEKDLGVHLHFEVHKDGEPLNPQGFLSSAEASVTSIQPQEQQMDQSQASADQTEGEDRDSLNP